MNLSDALSELATLLNISDDLSPFADEDTIGGYHPDPALRKWPPGAVWDVEGKTIYALIRALKPKKVVETGIGDGCSASHITAALRTNGSGKLTSIDRGNSGSLIPDDLRRLITIVGGDAGDWLEKQKDNSVDFIFEDADHSEAFAYRVGMLAQHKLKPGGVLVSHDAAHATVGQQICDGYTRAGLSYRVYSIGDSDCGLLVWRRGE